MLRKFLIATLLGSAVLGLSACNTVRGLGEDLESAANAVDNET